jgi:LPXTG-site transpeptidase (sortase) family protein
VSRRGFLAALAVAATGGAYGLGVRTPSGFASALLNAPAEHDAGPAPEPQVEVQEHVPGAPGRRTRKNLPPARLVVPAIGLESPVVPIGVKYDNRGKLAWETADFVVGHYINTANPGEEGNCVLSGHISSPRSGAIFNRLPDLAAGHGVAVATADSLYLYEVVDTRVVDPRTIEVMTPGTGAKLTLITCVPDGIYSHRLIVTALPI